MGHQGHHDVREVGTVLTGKRREKAIETHLRWLANRAAAEVEVNPEAPIAQFAAAHNRAKAQKRLASCGYYTNTKRDRHAV